MIPENIKKLLLSRNKDDQKIGLELAQKLRLDSPEFQIFLFHESHISSKLIDGYIDRWYNTEDKLEKEPYKYFRYRE